MLFHQCIYLVCLFVCEQSLQIVCHSLQFVVLANNIDIALFAADCLFEEVRELLDKSQLSLAIGNCCYSIHCSLQLLLDLVREVGVNGIV